MLQKSNFPKLQAEPPSNKNKHWSRFLSRGSLRIRFVIGTGLLLFVVLVGIIGFVTNHARVRMEEQTVDTVRALVGLSSSTLSAALSGNAKERAFETLPIESLDSEAIRRLHVMVTELRDDFLLDFAFVDHNQTVLFSLDPQQIGRSVSPPGDKIEVSATKVAGKTQIIASAPIQDDAERVIGSLHLTFQLSQLEAFLSEFYRTLSLVGGLILLLALVVAWLLITPLVKTTQQLTQYASQVREGDYQPVPSPTNSRGWSLLGANVSVRTRLTLMMVLFVVVMVVSMELYIVSTERYHVERLLQENMTTTVEWIAHLITENVALRALSEEEAFDFEALLTDSSLFELAYWQDVSEQLRGEHLAYVALVNSDRHIILSDRITLIGQEVTLPSETEIEPTTWRDEEIWTISTPLQEKPDGKQMGALQVGVRRAVVDAFLDESRRLLRLVDVVAILLAILLAQLIGRTVTAPLHQLATTTRRVSQGDLNVSFDVDSQDELTILATAFNEMVAGLREREWLRDIFGRFVSRDVAEALRTGQIRLEGENRIVSVLFCDIRDFTARSERNTPQDIVALLNEYLPIVIEAAQKFHGTVNKFGGDSTLIIYGAPRDLEESAYCAILTALEIRAQLAHLNTKLKARHQTPIRIGVGINTGVALAGAVGAKERQEYTVIGNTVNLASRIEALNKQYPHYDILISHWSYQALGKRQAEFTFADLGMVSIRGKREAVRVLAVLGLK